MLRALLATALAMLVAASLSQPASAAFTERDAARSVKVAFNYWESLRPGMLRDAGRRCRNQRLRIDWRHDMGSAMASAPVGGCKGRRPTITFERPTIRGLSDYHGCAVLTHELGHLLGLRHAHNDENLMSGERSRGARPPRNATWRRAWHRCS